MLLLRMKVMLPLLWLSDRPSPLRMCDYGQFLAVPILLTLRGLLFDLGRGLTVALCGSHFV